MPTRKSSRCASCAANPHDRPYITMWNTISKRKVAGTAAPCQAELEEYLRRHEHIVVYNGQDGGKQRTSRKRDRDRDRRRMGRSNLHGKTHEAKAITNIPGTANNDDRNTQENTVVELSDTAGSTARPGSSATITQCDTTTSGSQESTVELVAKHKETIAVHPHAHIALAQRIWTAEARIARTLQFESDSESDVEELDTLRSIRSRNNEL